MIEGHRRLVAAEQLGLREVPCDLADDRQADEAGQFLDMYVTNHYRKCPLTSMILRYVSLTWEEESSLSIHGGAGARFACFWWLAGAAFVNEDCSGSRGVAAGRRWRWLGVSCGGFAAVFQVGRDPVADGRREMWLITQKVSAASMIRAPACASSASVAEAISAAVRFPSP